MHIHWASVVATPPSPGPPRPRRATSHPRHSTLSQANRDLLDYRFLYRLTSEKLRADNAGDAGRSAALDAARGRAVRACQAFDTSLFKQVAAAEARLGGLLAQYMQGKPPSAEAVVEAAGTGTQATFAFWMVLKAAASAWEVKLPVASVADQARQKLAELGEVEAALTADALMDANGARPIAQLLALPDVSNITGTLLAADVRNGAAKARALLEELEPDAEARVALVRRLGCTAVQAQRHGFQAYNPLVQRAAALYDCLVFGTPQPLAAVDILSKRGPPSSRMVQMANDADTILQEAGVEIPLFW